MLRHFVIQLESIPTLASGMPGLVHTRFQLKLPGGRARLGLERTFLGGFTSSVARGGLGALRGLPRLSFSMKF